MENTLLNENVQVRWLGVSIKQVNMQTHIHTCSITVRILYGLFYPVVVVVVVVVVAKACEDVFVVAEALQPNTTGNDL